MILTRTLLLFMVHRLSVCSDCPSPCNCTENAVLCMKSELKSIPQFENLINSPTIIDLSGNELNDIGPDDLSFEKTYLVKEMYLNNSEVFDISYEAFDEMENLQELYLGENLLNSVPENFIEDLPNMLVLELSGNHFSVDMPTIKSTSLEVLSLANSKITNVTAEALMYMPNLKMLLLQQNNIKHIDPAVFEQIPTKTDFSVRLGYNPWECDCKTIELFEYLARKNYIDTDAERYQCLSSTGAYLDIFHRNTMEINSSLCVTNHEIHEGPPTRKRNSQIDTEVDNGKEMESIGQKHDKPYSLIKENTSIETDSTNNKTNENIEVVICQRPNQMILGVQMGLNEFLIAMTSFLMGLFIGFSVFQWLSSTKHRRLDTSDSTTKLIG